MKRILIVLCALCLLLSACGKAPVEPSATESPAEPTPSPAARQTRLSQEERLQHELSAVRAKADRLEEDAFTRIAKAHAGAGDVLLLREEMSSDGVRRLCDAVSAQCGGRCAVFAGADGGYKYAVIHPGQDISALIKHMNQALNGRGGGRDGFAQGSVAATAEEIRAFFDC